ncbi:hypothetical protein [Polyangium aurulentum]|uniref:hypothetical protein n=1 Tax=Polyangium aurulentum TaxID=2567896 RepID=UPI0010ADC9D9|nr:hypothetical protein [Polyangium aurulentum]UQA58656.1 hypothetical protein E8A73_046715 [Polyangium aurulentum]
METVTGLLLAFALLLLPLLQGVAEYVVKKRREDAMRAAQQGAKAHSPPREPALLRPLPAPRVPQHRSLEDVTPRSASREERSLEMLPGRPISLETTTPEPTRDEELVVVAPPQRARRALLRGPGEVRRGILLATLLGTPRGLER